ncbi:7634_t:CDS:2 [Paraglomus occultum]|uniref:7634_t:CDS:1 n=1 Tax=Paraglomus occultum TaxID=144539 RepID=A0A9N9FCI7_9GLOM|nr:7634_t:CDS:2 [Paraglomus occultum]
MSLKIETLMRTALYEHVSSIKQPQKKAPLENAVEEIAFAANPTATVGPSAESLPPNYTENNYDNYAFNNNNFNFMDNNIENNYDSMNYNSNFINNNMENNQDFIDTNMETNYAFNNNSFDMENSYNFMINNNYNMETNYGFMNNYEYDTNNNNYAVINNYEYDLRCDLQTLKCEQQIHAASRQDSTSKEAYDAKTEPVSPLVHTEGPVIVEGQRALTAKNLISSSPLEGPGVMADRPTKSKSTR